MMSYRKKQLLGFGVILFALMILLLILAFMLDGVKKNLAEIMDERYDKVSRAVTFRNNFSAINSDLGYLVYETDPLRSENHLIEIRSKSEAAYTDLTSLQTHRGDNSGEQLLAAVKNGFDRYMLIVNRVAEARASGSNLSAASLYVENAQTVRLNLLRTLSEYTAIQENKMNWARLEAERQFSRMLMVSAVSAAAILLIGILAAVWVIRGTGRNLRRITDAMDKFDPGAIAPIPRLEVDSNDEIGNIARGYNHMIDTLEDHNRKVREFNQKIEENHWLQTKLSELALLYQQAEDKDSLARLFLSSVSPAVNASSGLFYSRDTDGNGERFVRIAAYATDRPEGSNEAFLPGEGLIGQAALDGRDILIDVSPEHDGTTILAGGGTYRPRQIWVIPIEANDRVEAVVELSTLVPFTELHRQLMEQLRSTLGIALQNVNGRMEVDRLLQESQLLTEELRTQQKELRSVNDQLKQQYIQADRSRIELLETQHELELSAEELRRSSQYKSEFLANMSHELRTPLNSILILSQLIAENAEDTGDEGRSYAEIIHRSGQDLLEIVNDVLDLSKVEAGMLDINPEPVSLHDFPELINYGFDTIAKQKNLEFEVHVSDNLPEAFYTDGKRMQQIIKNLLSNAFKFTQAGKVCCSLEKADAEAPPCVASEGDAEQTAIAIKVSDTGIGIPEDKRDMIFEAFRQGDGRTERMYGGTGLGLSICREFAGLLGGCLTVESEEGQGSTFTLYLPSMPPDRLSADSEAGFPQ
ncbi:MULTISPECIES: ATP-binding protein [Saccharibacillus]|uniref:ATP-binding protein n=1 Tax=Saccharibacillus TaxID=456492 RepID=UPI00123BC8F7|nr:ATP-binding protein [Saccharibacillus sp. WB 17]MWJ30380.1 HAMP domain-containing protein [Saccharibacillus sp. WB 17]